VKVVVDVTDFPPPRSAEPGLLHGELRDEEASRPESLAHLLQGPSRVADMFENVVANDEVKAIVRRHVRKSSIHLTASLPGGRCGDGVHLEADGMRYPCSDEGQHPAVAAAEVQNPFGTVKVRLEILEIQGVALLNGVPLPEPIVLLSCGTAVPSAHKIIVVQATLPTVS
jgi:hypothetical protein